MKNPKIRRKHRQLKKAVINTITYIASIAMFILIAFYGLSGQTPYIIGAVACWLWCMIYAWANGSFNPVARKASNK